MIGMHPHKKCEETETTGRLVRRTCVQCLKKTGWFCALCNVFCCPEIMDGKHPRNCYKEHIIKIHPKLASKTKAARGSI
jgi:hypothetical protein